MTTISSASWRRLVAAGVTTTALTALCIGAPVAQAYSGTIFDQDTCLAAGGSSFDGGVPGISQGQCLFTRRALTVGSDEQLDLRVRTELSDVGSDNYSGYATPSVWAGTVTVDTPPGDRAATLFVVGARVQSNGPLTIKPAGVFSIGAYSQFVTAGATRFEGNTRVVATQWHNTGNVLVTSTGTLDAGPNVTLVNDGTITFECGANYYNSGVVVTGNAPVFLPCGDTTPPTLSPTVTPNPVLLGGTATATPGATDDVAVASSDCDSPDASSVGLKTVSCTATDTAGNTTTGSAPYLVQYGWSGFAAPVNGSGVVNTAKAGQTIPLKFTLTTASGAPYGGLTTATISAVTTNCGTGAATDEVETYTTAGASGLQNLGGGNYQLNWKTSKADAGRCKTLQLDLGEGTPRTALFQFR